MEKELVRAGNGRMVRRRPYGQLVIPQHLIDRLQESKVAHGELEVQRREAARNWAESAARWIAENRPELTVSATPKLSPIAPWSQQAALGEFEDCYKGNAVRLMEADLGEVWWLDPEGRSVSHHVFATRCGERSGYAIEYEIHFRQK